MKEPDLGTAAVLVLVVVAMVFAAGLQLALRRAGVVLLMLPVLTYYIVTRRLPREPRSWRSWIRTIRALDRYTYQLRQSQIALGSGGPFGLGLGSSMQKPFFLPEAAQRLHLRGDRRGTRPDRHDGAGRVLRACIAWRGLRAALLAPDRFGTLVGIGLAMMVGMQAFINMSVVTGWRRRRAFRCRSSAPAGRRCWSICSRWASC